MHERFSASGALDLVLEATLFVDIVMPATGDAPPTPFDGISFKPGSAKYNNLSLATTVLTFNAQGQATHPFAKNPDGTLKAVPKLIVEGEMELRRWCEGHALRELSKQKRASLKVTFENLTMAELERYKHLHQKP